MLDKEEVIWYECFDCKSYGFDLADYDRYLKEEEYELKCPDCGSVDISAIRIK